MKFLGTLVLVVVIALNISAQLDVAKSRSDIKDSRLMPIYDLNLGGMYLSNWEESMFVSINAGVSQKVINGGAHGIHLQGFISNLSAIGIFYRYTKFIESETTWHVSGGVIRASGGYGLALEGSHYVSPKVSFLGGTRFFPSTDRGSVHEVYAGLGLHKNAATIGTGALLAVAGTLMSIAIGRSQ